jgi:signal transduction histidine kinase
MEEKLQGADLEYLFREIPQAIRQSLEGVEHVSNIVGSMSELTHSGSGKKQETDLHRVLEGTLTLCRSEWSHLADVVADFDSEFPMVHCLPTDIHRVMVNLMVNAAHAVADATHNGEDGKGTIRVSTRRLDPWVEIRVQDTGTGIPEEIRPRVFDLFFTTKEVGRGTGQGLAIVHSVVVEKHGGSIRFETEVGHGTTFIVRLPIDGKPHPAEEPADRERMPSAV